MKESMAADCVKKILITGASGFIGSFLVEEALRKGWEVWAGIRETSSRVYLTDPAIHFIDLNYSDAVILRNQIKTHVFKNNKWDYIIHNAGVTKCLKSIDFEKINYLYTRNFIDALRDGGHIPEKFLLMSSLGAFGPGEETNYTPISPEDTPKPNTAYGRSKLLAEQYLQSLSDFPYIILRPTGVYGPRERDYYQMLRMINAGFDLKAGFKSQKLAFIYVKDLVKVCFSALESPFRNKAWFVADGTFYAAEAYSGILKKALNKKYVLRITCPLFVLKVLSSFGGLLSKVTGTPTFLNSDKYKIMKQRNWTCDISSLEKDLHFRADYSLQRGIEESVTWYKEKEWL